MTLDRPHKRLAGLQLVICFRCCPLNEMASNTMCLCGFHRAPGADAAFDGAPLMFPDNRASPSNHLSHLFCLVQIPGTRKSFPS